MCCRRWKRASGASTSPITSPGRMSMPSRPRTPRASPSWRASANFPAGSPGESVAEEIRRAVPADAAAIAALTRAAYEKWIPVIGRAPKPMTADYDIVVREHLIDLLFVGGALVALVECIREPDHLLIENLAVDPAQQGRG